MKTLLLIMTLLSLSSQAFSASYYVDFATGADTNAGTSTGVPFKHCPGDTNATNTAAATTLAAGDTVYFKGGVQYNGTVTLNWSGTSGSRLVYDGNTSGAWGTGRAIIDGQDTRYYGFYTGSTRNYFTIRGFEVRNIAYRTTGNSWEVGGIYIDASHSGALIDNNYVHDVGYWNNDCANPNGEVPAGQGIRLQMPDGSTASNNEVTKTGGNAFTLSGSINSTLSGNNIHDYITWGVDLTGDYRAPDNNLITGNTIHDLYQHDAGFRTGGCDPHTDFIFVRKGGGTRPQRTTIEKNLFYNNYTFTDVSGTAMVFTSFADNTVIRNNVFINSHSYYAISISWTSGDTKIYNNTIYNPRESPIDIDMIGASNEIRNNLAVGVGAYLNLADSTTQSALTTVNNNLFIAATNQVHKVSPYTNWTLAQWRALGWDVNSVAPADIAAIKFMNTTGYPTSCETMDLRLQADSPAVDNGADLSATFTADYNGATRSGTWDLGAYESGAGSPPASPSSPVIRGVSMGPGVSIR